MRVSCIIPAYNEAATIAEVIRAVRACPRVEEVIVVSDGSSDATPMLAAAAGADEVIVLPRNGGKSRAVLEALPRAAGDIILLIDGDLHGLRPAHIEDLLAPVLEGRAAMAVALFAAEPMHRLMWTLSGQRAIRRVLLDAAERLDRAGFGLEIALQQLARRRRMCVARVLWHGVGHRSKREKYGPMNGVRLKVRASSDIARQAGTMLVPRRPARRRILPAAMILMGVILISQLSVPLIFVRHATARAFPRIAAPAAGDRLLVVVAHPDDETIGAGALIAASRRAGAEVTVVVVTNGDSNRLSAAVLTHTVRPRAAQLRLEGQVRQLETRAALARLGVAPSSVVFLGFPDRALEEILRSDLPVRSPFTGFDRVGYPDTLAPGTAYTREALVGLMRRMMDEARPTMIVTHLPFDRHADHRAVAALVDAVRGDVPVVGFLVHAAGFPRPLRLAPRDPLIPPASVAETPGWTWLRFDVAPDLRALKQEAANEYRSQLLTPYLRLLIAAFVRTNELFAVRTP